MKVKNYTCDSWWFKLSVPFVLGNDITAHWLELARRLQILSSSVSLIGHQSLLILPPSMFHFFSLLASTSVLVQSITLGYINYVCSVTQSCLTLCDPWSVAHQTPLSMEFSRQVYWSRLPFPLGISLTYGLNPHLLHWEVDSLPLSHVGSPYTTTAAFKKFFLLCWVFSSCGAQALECSGSVVAASGLSCLMVCGILIARPGTEPASHALEGRFLNSGPPEKSLADS